MTAWPGNPIASMDVDNFSGGTKSSITLLSANSQQTVTDINIEFTVNIAYHDHPYFDHGRGYFSISVAKLTTNGWQQVITESTTLGNNNDSGDWYEPLTIVVTMTDQVELYQIVLHCETQDTIEGTSENATVYAQATQGESAIGDFTLDFIPMSIVYCPPGQDMTASLTQSESYGTRFTVGESSGMEAQTGEQLKVDFLGLFGAGVGFSQSQSTTNQSTSGIQVSHFRTTVITADNQKAIGRAYWGPLGDIFVILVNPSFAASRRADGTILYSLRQIAQVLAIPAWKLLRPDGDPIASAVPEDVRQRLLQLDPFITNLQLFFPDSGGDLGLAANPYADPLAGNRAELLGRWWLDAGSELNYALGESQQLFSTDASEVKFTSSVTISASAGQDFDDISAGLSLSQTSTTSIGFQTSKETESSYSTTASCFLIHNQNERDLDGIEVYYDKVFSTFMFRRVLARPRLGLGGCAGALGGRITDVQGLPLRKLTVQVADGAGAVYQTTTSVLGEYGFSNLCPGTYTITAGDQKSRLEIDDAASPFSPARRDLTNVRRVIDLSAAPVWEVSEALGLSSELVRRIGARLPELRDLRALARLVGASEEQLALWRQRNVLSWPKAQRQAPPAESAR